ncbi:NmrA family NAD(P)-binding protein [Shewanella sp. YLB-07]|uniref:NmrA family NAD(P)-binding protein n=1 Tax=Shewanella sp. YLB-07 TaxID=2601268 RepID=UPI00128B62E7|nr:NmrA family NAD(P)-binding protein [Shewanella sp. YLB-07]MPY22616.1 hypothetical protein [Shewanella sp. YLB-07]
MNSGFTIKAVSRNLQSQSADRLRQQGVAVVYGDLDKPETLAQILKGAYGVYSVQNNWTSSIEVEIAQGKALADADAAKSARVQHFVYSSVGGAERQTGIPHFDSKREIERHILNIGLPYTFIRPAFFIENFLATGSFAFINWSLLSWALKKIASYKWLPSMISAPLPPRCFPVRHNTWKRESNWPGMKKHSKKLRLFTPE